VEEVSLLRLGVVGVHVFGDESSVCTVFIKVQALSLSWLFL
jgi:hypothetical protein